METERTGITSVETWYQAAIYIEGLERRIAELERKVDLAYAHLTESSKSATVQEMLD